MEFEEHNEEVRQVWEAYRRREPIRPPVVFGINPRYTMLGRPEIHGENFDSADAFEHYSEDPDTMLEHQLIHQNWVRHNIWQDAEMGVPAEGWDVRVDLQNYYEAGWLGCEVHYRKNQVPDSEPLLTEDRKNLLFDAGIPDPFEGGLMKKNWGYYDHLVQRREEGFTFKGKPIRNVHPSGLGTDGPCTVACNIRGATEFMMDLVGDPEYAHRLLDFITEATIQRLKAFRKRLGMEEKTKSWGFADDSIQLISGDIYREMILPYHRRLVEAFAESGPNSIHLCGDATRHFPTVRDELNVWSFDTGFPVDFAALRKALGPDVEIRGGPSVPFLAHASLEEVENETRRILDSGIREGGRFLLREGNNVAPEIYPEALKALYETCRKCG